MFRWSFCIALVSVGCATADSAKRPDADESRCLVNFKGTEWSKVLVEDDTAKVGLVYGGKMHGQLFGDEIRYPDEAGRSVLIGRIEDGKLVLEMDDGRFESTPIEDGGFRVRGDTFAYTPACTQAQAALGAATFYSML